MSFLEYFGVLTGVGVDVLNNFKTCRSRRL